MAVSPATGAMGSGWKGFLGQGSPEEGLGSGEDLDEYRQEERACQAGEGHGQG